MAAPRFPIVRQREALASCRLNSMSEDDLRET